MLKTKKCLVQAVSKSDKNCCPTFLHKLAQHATTRNRNVGIQGKATITNCKDGLYSLTPLLTLYSKHMSLPIHLPLCVTIKSLCSTIKPLYN